MSRATADIALGLGIAALGALILLQTGEIRVSPVYARVGPKDIPLVVGAILATLGLALAWQGWRPRPKLVIDPPKTMDAPGSKLDTPGTGGDRVDWMPMAMVAAGLVQQMLLIQFLGFVLTAAILFYCVAFGFESRRYLRDAIVAIAISLVTYVGFVYLLGLNLPAGILSGVL